MKISFIFIVVTMNNQEEIQQKDEDCLKCTIINTVFCFGMSAYILHAIRDPGFGRYTRRFFGGCSVGSEIL